MWPKLKHPKLGILWRGWGNWKGTVTIDGDPVSLILTTPRTLDASPFLERMSRIVDEFERFRTGMASILYHDYQVYKKMEIENDPKAKELYQSYPKVASDAEIWSVLKPDTFCHVAGMDRNLGNASLLLQVNWPNPHLFQVYFRLDDSGWEHMLTDLVG